MEWIAVAKRKPALLRRNFMDNLIEAISGLISKAVTLAVTGSILALLAGEIKLAALKKASQGSSRLSGFTQKMTKTKLNF
jgi:hypothetical protein